MKAYIDTSVLAAFYCPETLSQVAQRELAKVADRVISPLVELEFCSAVAMKVRTKELASDEAQRVFDLFQKHLDAGEYRVVPIENSEFVAARNWIKRLSTPLRALDAIHLATAFANALVLLTADRGLAKIASHFSVRHELVQ